MHRSGSGTVEFTEKQPLPGTELKATPLYGNSQGTAHE